MGRRWPGDARRWRRPGHLTRAGREDRHRLEAAQARYDAVAAEQGQRHAWLEAHADTLGYREELGDSVVERRHELGVSAALTRPGHVVDLLGAVPDDSGAMELWVDRAVRIEAYREEWAVAPEQLRERPSELCQQRAWDQAIYITEVLVRVAAPRLEQDLELGIEMGW